MYDRSHDSGAHRLVRQPGALVTPLRLAVDVVMERVPLANRWASERWQPSAVEIAAPRADAPRARDVVPGSGAATAVDAAGNRWRCPGFEIELHPTEVEGYFLNITAPDPRIFVMWRLFDGGVAPPARPVLVTVSYNEAGRFMDGGEQVEGVPMLPSIAEWMRAFIDVHYKPEPRRKVRRNDPLADVEATRPRGHRS
jgi:hypothetical protein